MNPKDFEWTEEQQVTVTNPTAERFTWQVHGKEYSLEGGQAASMPGYLAWVYVYGQACLAAQAEKMWDQWNDLPIRKEFYARFVAGVQPLMSVTPIEKSLVEPVADSSDGEEGSPTEEDPGETGSDSELPTGGASYTPDPKKVGKSSAAKSSAV